MINKILSAICLALADEFGDGYEIYKTVIEQGLNEPCFFVQAVVPVSQNTITGRRKRAITYMVQYFPKDSDSPYTEINDVIERLDDCLDFIETDSGGFWGVDKSARTVDRVLNYEATYEFFEVDIAESDSMEDLTENYSLKERG